MFQLRASFFPGEDDKHNSIELLPRYKLIRMSSNKDSDCTACEGNGCLPRMCNRNRTYFVKWETCMTCCGTGTTNYYVMARMGRPCNISVGYIPEGERVPTIDEVLKCLR